LPTHTAATKRRRSSILNASPEALDLPSAGREIRQSNMAVGRAANTPYDVIGIFADNDRYQHLF
jgi:hypothetical protein